MTSYKTSAKLQTVTTNTQPFTGQMPILSPNQQCQSTEWRKYHTPLTCSPQAHLEPFHPSLDTKALGYLGGGLPNLSSSRQPSDASIPALILSLASNAQMLKSQLPVPTCWQRHRCFTSLQANTFVTSITYGFCLTSLCGAVAELIGSRTCDQEVARSNPGRWAAECNLGKLCTPMCLCHQAV